MPRSARIVFTGIPHHVTQRGNRRQTTFFDDDGRTAYLRWLSEYSKKHNVEVLAYCLMTNHVHLVLVPGESDGLAKSLNTVHMRYTQYVNKEQDWNGRLWQGRYFSSPLDETYMWSTIRYVERNPVRARIVEKADHYPWSSAPAHCGLAESEILTRKLHWLRKLEQVRDWSAWLSIENSADDDETIRKHCQKGLPCGSNQFISKLERLSGRVLGYRHQGRPRKEVI